MVFICIVMVYSAYFFVNENHEEFSTQSTEYDWQQIFFNLNVGGKYFGIYNKKNKYNLLRMDKK